MKTFQVSGNEVKINQKPLDKVSKAEFATAQDVDLFNHSLKTEKNALNPLVANELPITQQDIISEHSAPRGADSYAHQTMEGKIYHSNLVREASTMTAQQIKVGLSAQENKHTQPVKQDQLKEEITPLKDKVNANTMLKADQVKAELSDQENKQTPAVNHVLGMNTIKASELVLNHAQSLKEPTVDSSKTSSLEGKVTQPIVTTKFEPQRPVELGTEKTAQQPVIQNTEMAKPTPLNQGHSSITKGMLTASDITAHTTSRAFTEQEPKSLEGLVNAKSALLPTPDVLFQQVLKSTKPENPSFQTVATEVLASVNLAKSQAGEEMTVKLAHPLFSGSEINFKMENKTLTLTFVAKDADVALLAQQFLPEMKLMLQDKFPQFNHDCLLQNNEHTKQFSKKQNEQDEQKEQQHHEETLNEEELT